MRTCVIFNPSARGDKARSLCTHGVLPDSEWRPTRHSGDATQLAADAARENFPVIVAAGGDGTINEVVNGIALVPGALEKIRFGILPLGTVNVFARELAIPRSLAGAARVIGEGHSVAVDLGCAEFSQNGTPRKRYFVQLAGAGVDSRAIELVSWELKKKAGPLAYVMAGLQAMREEKPVIRAESGGVLEGDLAVVGNGRFYGGSFAVFPGASLFDGRLHARVLPRAGWPALIHATLSLALGQAGRIGAALPAMNGSVKLSSTRRAALQLDGENVGELPAVLTVCAAALQVLAPASVVNDRPVPHAGPSAGETARSAKPVLQE